MTAALTKDRLSEIRAQTDIVQVCRGVGAEIIETGPIRCRMTCPFCKASDFYANTGTRIAHCVRCKWTGDCYRLIQMAFGVSFEEAFGMLEAWANARTRRSR